MIVFFKRALLRFADGLQNFWFAPAEASQYECLRVAYALASLAQLICLWPERYYWFTDEGLIWNASASSAGLIPSFFSYAHSTSAVTVVFIFMALSMLGLALGFLPRLFLIVLAYWHYSLAFDLSLAMSGYDMVLKTLGMILLISPLGSRHNFLTGLKNLKVKGIETAPVYGLYLIRWQLLWIYVSTVWVKLPDPHWRNGQFISYFMMSLYSLFPYALFARAEALSTLLTYGTLLIELSVPFLLFSPRLRIWGVLLGLGLHVGIAVTSSLWLFSLSMLILYPAFVSTSDWRRWKDSLLTWKGALCA